MSDSHNITIYETPANMGEACYHAKCTCGWFVQRGFESSRQEAIDNHIEFYTSGNRASTKPSTTQVGGTHYSSMAIQPIDFIHANKLSFIEGSVIKYVCRHAKKNGKQDLEKAIHFLHLLIEKHYG